MAKGYAQLRMELECPASDRKDAIDTLQRMIILRGEAMNFHQRGTELINSLKDHVLEVLRGHPDAEPAGPGVFQEEIARRAGLHNMGTGELDHTCGEMLRLLHKENMIELVEEAEQDEKRKRWRLNSR